MASMQDCPIPVPHWSTPRMQPSKSKMRILILVDCYLPGTKSGAKQIHDLGVEAVRQGHEVTVLTPSDMISQGVEISLEEGLRVVRVRTRKIKGANKVLRALEETRLSTTLWNATKHFLCQNPCDLIIFYSPTIFFGGLVQKLKARWHCPSYLILRDIFPQWALDLGILRRNLVFAYFRRQELQQYAAADIIAVQSKADLDYFARELPDDHHRLEVLYNWMALEEPILPRTGYRTQLGLQDKVVFFYGGNVGVAQDMDNILRLAENLSGHHEVYFLLVGDGSMVKQLKRSIVRRGLDNIQILPPVGQQEYLSIVSEIDVGIVSLDRRLKTHNIPGKTLSYLYWSKPVLASINPGNDLFDLLTESNAGLCFVNGEDEGFSAAALRLANDPALRASMGRNSRRLLEPIFSAEPALHQIMKHFPSAACTGEAGETVLRPRCFTSAY